MNGNEGLKAMSIAEATKAIGCSRALITAAIERGELASFRLGDRVFLVRAAVERLLAGDKELIETQGGKDGV